MQGQDGKEAYLMEQGGPLRQQQASLLLLGQHPVDFSIKNGKELMYKLGQVGDHPVFGRQ